MVKNQSEVARLLGRIREEYEAAQRGLTGLSYGASQHEFITARMENIASCFAKLRLHMSPEQVAALVSAAADEDLPPHVEDSIRSGELD